MLEQISRKYVVLTDSENAKIPQMLAPENLRRLIKTDNAKLNVINIVIWLSGIRYVFSNVRNSNGTKLLTIACTI